MSHRKSAAIALAAAAAVMAMAASASAAVKVDVLAAKIDNPRGLALSSSGTVYVASAGRGGPRCLDKKKENCPGFSSRVLAVSGSGAKRVVAKNLLSVAGGDGSFAVGADDVSVGADGRIFTIMTSGSPKDIGSAPKPFQAAAGKLVQVAPGQPRAVAAIDQFEWTHNADGVKGDRNSDPYAVLALPDRIIVADAGANDVLSVAPDGTVSLLALIPKNGKAQSVPTSLALGPDGAVYVGELAEGAGRGKARVWRVPLDGTPPTVFATGFTTITGVGFGPDGSLYVTELSTNPKKQTAPGAIVRRKPDGTTTTLTRASLLFPAGMAVASNGTVYVSNYSVLPATTPKKSPFKGRGGQLLRITGF